MDDRKRLIAGLCGLLLLAGCGGGGGSNGPTLNVPSTTVTFTATSPAAVVPAPQTLTGNVTNTGSASGTLYILFIQDSQELVTASQPVVDPGTATGSVTLAVRWPAIVGTGNHSTTVTIRACLNDPTCRTGNINGSPRTVTVNYEVGSPVQGDTLMPGLAVAGTPGRAVLRGSNLSGVTSVRFGSLPATTTVVDSTELQVDFPALPAGTQTVTLMRGSASSVFDARLEVVAPQAFMSADLIQASPPANTVHTLTSAAFDAVRNALLTSVDTTVILNAIPMSASQDNFIRRQAYVNGSWQAPTIVNVPGLRTLALSPDQSTLYTAVDNTLERRDPATLAVLGSSFIPAALIGSSGNQYITQIRFLNDGNVLVITGYRNGGPTPVYLFSPRTSSFSRPGLLGSDQFATNLFLNAVAGVPDDGSLAMIADSVGIGPRRALQSYRSSTGKWSQTTSTFDQFGVAAQFSSNASIALIADSSPGTNGRQVVNASLQRVGTLLHAPDGALLARNGRRAYALDRTGVPACSVRAYDLNSIPLAPTSEYPEILTGFPITRTCGSSAFVVPLSLLAPDEHAMFVLNGNVVSVIPLP